MSGKELNYNYFHMFVPEKPLNVKESGLKPDEKGCVLRGHLAKKNWVGQKQLRFFELYKTGQLKYFKDITDHKGTILIGKTSNLRKTGRNEITFLSLGKKDKEYVLV